MASYLLSSSHSHWHYLPNPLCFTRWPIALFNSACSRPPKSSSFFCGNKGSGKTTPFHALDGHKFMENEFAVTVQGTLRDKHKLRHQGSVVSYARERERENIIHGDNQPSWHSQ
jgi:hypothetical protein